MSNRVQTFNNLVDFCHLLEAWFIKINFVQQKVFKQCFKGQKIIFAIVPMPANISVVQNR
jgi:hypothetical protein